MSIEVIAQRPSSSSSKEQLYSSERERDQEASSRLTARLERSVNKRSKGLHYNDSTARSRRRERHRDHNQLVVCMDKGSHENGYVQVIEPFRVSNKHDKLTIQISNFVLLVQQQAVLYQTCSVWGIFLLLPHVVSCSSCQRNVTLGLLNYQLTTFSLSSSNIS